jgi:hypothetical protein
MKLEVDIHAIVVMEEDFNMDWSSWKFWLNWIDAVGKNWKNMRLIWLIDYIKKRLSFQFEMNWARTGWVIGIPGWFC